MADTNDDLMVRMGKGLDSYLIEELQALNDLKNDAVAPYLPLE